jgi:hypothetical protein
MDHTVEVLCFDPGGNKKIFCTVERPKSMGVSQLSVQGIFWAISPGLQRPDLQGDFSSPKIL